jgi:hypothetical protein
MTGARRGTAVLLARVRVPLVVVAVAVLLVGPWVDVPIGVAMGLFALALAVYLRLGVVRGDPVVVRPPVHGRWLAVNSPADHVPSHGLLAYGQSHAVDLVHVPEGTERVRYGGRGLRGLPPEGFAGFGRPVHAPVDGVVVRAVDRFRDHRARTTYPQILYLLVSGTFRELRGAGGLMGNHVVLRAAEGSAEGSAEGTYVVLAHLRRGSVRVRAGDVVRAGEVVGGCGNSGNSSEPHVHVQVMDHRWPWCAAGLPMAFAAAGGAPSMPSGREPVTWPEPDGAQTAAS